jgi:hypothetical protein
MLLADSQERVFINRKVARVATDVSAKPSGTKEAN